MFGQSSWTGSEARTGLGLRSMSTSREQGAVFYVVSRSGKVLGTDDRPRRFGEADFFEGELEGWIFWGSSKRSTGSIALQDASGSLSGSKGVIRNSFHTIGRTGWRKRIPFVVWGNNGEFFNDVFPPISWRQTKLHWRKNTARKGSLQGKRNPWMESDDTRDLSLSGPVLSQRLSRLERYFRMDQNVKTGLSQLAVLQKWDAECSWEPGTRELAARWTAWLLKMLRKSHPRPLQHLIFTMCAAVLPVICCSLVRAQWTRIPDPELCRSVDIVWSALDKSYACFTPAQWDILQERLIECRQLRMKVGSSSERDLLAREPADVFEIVPCKVTKQQRIQNSSLGRIWPGSHLPRFDTTDEELSNNLVQSEGVPALVKRALHEKLVTPHLKRVDGEGLAANFGGSGTIVSLVCPLSGRRVKVPARGKGCNHLASFDLEMFLEGHSIRSSFSHQPKKPKTETRAWCCPICGSDATWPQIIVDRLLVRILEVLPVDMPQVCVFPNGRWRVVWSPGGEDHEKIRTKPTKVADHAPSRSAVNSGMYCIGQFGELRLDPGKAFDRCIGHQEFCDCGDDVLKLDRAYKAWEGVDFLRDNEANKKVKVEWGADSTLAVWTGDHHSNTDSVCEASVHNGFNLQNKVRMLNEEVIDSGSNTRAEANSPTCEHLGNVSEAGNEAAENIKLDDDETHMMSQSKLILEALQALGGMTSVCNVARMRVGQPKARRKLMAKKT